MDGRPKGWSVRRKFAVACLICAALFAAFLELYFGSWLSTDRTSRLLLVRDADYVFDVTHLYPASAPIRYRRDRYGLRGMYPDLARIDILTLGGSATDQRFVGEGQTWQDALAEAFAKNGTPFSVVNAGVDGQSTAGNIRNFELWFPELPSFRPKYILAYIGVNDLFTSEGAANDDLAGRSTVKSILKSKSGLYRLSWILTGMYQAAFRFPLRHRKIDFASEEWTESALQSDYGFLEPRVQAFEHRLRLLTERIRTLAAIPIYVTQASHIYKQTGGRLLGSAQTLHVDGRRVNGVDVARMLREVHEATLRVCREARAICFDLERELRLEDKDFYDYFHNTPAGCAKIGGYLFARLEGFVVASAKSRSASGTLADEDGVSAPGRH